MYTFTSFPKIQIPSATPSSSKLPPTLSSRICKQPTHTSTRPKENPFDRWRCLHTGTLSPIHPASVFLHEVSSSGRASSRTRPRSARAPVATRRHLDRPPPPPPALENRKNRGLAIQPFQWMHCYPAERAGKFGGDIRRRQVFMSGPPLPFFPPLVGGREREREEGGEKRRWPVGSLMKSTIV